MKFQVKVLVTLTQEAGNVYVKSINGKFAVTFDAGGFDSAEEQLHDEYSTLEEAMVAVSDMIQFNVENGLYK